MMKVETDSVQTNAPPIRNAMEIEDAPTECVKERVDVVPIP